AGGCFPEQKKARQARIGHRGHVSEAAHALEAGSCFPEQKKMSRRVSLADSFFLSNFSEDISYFSGTEKYQMKEFAYYRF
ncbi:MAG: hypothetical protein FWF77_01850, partial [Defluviitaleaceae bacterium]|nr:hypothetical protein [Defluviitaleaceae bacterium]